MKVLLKKSEAASPFSFIFTDKDGKMLVKSESYKQKTSAKNGIESVKKNCVTDERYEMKNSKNGKFFFNVKSINGQIVCTSALFDGEDERKKSITYLKKYGPNALVEEM